MAKQDKKPKNSLFDTAPSITSTAMDQRSEFIGSAQNADFGESQYDENTPVSMVESGEYIDLRGERQGKLDRLANAVPRLIGKVGTEIAKTPGYLYALGESGLTDTKLSDALNNSWINSLEKADQKVKDEFAIYKPKSVREGNLWDNLTSTSFWTDEGVDGAGYLISMIGTGVALNATGIAGKVAGFSKLSNLLGTSKTALKSGIELGQATLLNTALEAAAETKGVADSLRESFDIQLGKKVDPSTGTAYIHTNPKTGQLWTEDEAKEAIGDASVNTFQMNLGILLVPNLIMNKNILGRFGKDKSALNQFRDASGRLVTTNPVIKKSFIRQAAEVIGVNAASEGFLEEGGQTTVENYNKKVALGLTNAGVLEGLANEYIETLGTTEGQKAILLGAVLGSLGGIVGRRRQNKAEAQQRSVLAGLINDNFEGFSTSMNSILEKDKEGNIIVDEETGKPKINIEQTANVIANLVKEQQSTNLQDLEALKGNKDMYDYIFNQQLARFALPYLDVEGGTEILSQHIDELSDNIVSSSSDKLEDNNHRTDIKKQIKDFQSIYNSINDSINDLPLEQLSKDKTLVGQFANKLSNTAYQESAKQIFLSKKIKELESDLFQMRSSASENVSQFNIETERINNRLELLKQSLETSVKNYDLVFNTDEITKAFSEFSDQVVQSQQVQDIQQVPSNNVQESNRVAEAEQLSEKGRQDTRERREQLIQSGIDPNEATEIVRKEWLQTAEGQRFIELSQTTPSNANSTSENVDNSIQSRIDNANSKDELADLFDEILNENDDIDAEQLGEIMSERLKTIEEQDSHLSALEATEASVENLNKEDHSEELNIIKNSLQGIKGLTNYDKYSKDFKERLEKSLLNINNILSESDIDYDIINETSNNTSAIISYNNDLDNKSVIGVQDNIQNFKSFTSKVYNAVMIKLFESSYVKDKGFRFNKNNQGEAIRTNSLISMSVNDPQIVKEGDAISFELIDLPADQNDENLQSINNSRELINKDSQISYTQEDKDFGKYYTENIAIRHKESNQIIGFLAIPHAINISSKDDIESLESKVNSRNLVISQRKKIIDLLDNSQPVETVIFAKGPGKLLLKSDKDGMPIMSSVLSRDQDLIDGKDIFLIDKGYREDESIEGFSIPNSNDFTKRQDKDKIEKISETFSSRTFSDKKGMGKGRIYKAVVNAVGTWSLIPVYPVSIGETQAVKLVSQLKKYIVPIEDGYTVDLKRIYKELGSDIYITNPDKKGILRIDKFNINGRKWGALLNSKQFEEDLVKQIAKSKYNITTQSLNIDINLKDKFETNAYQEEGQFFVQPYIEFKGFSEDQSANQKAGVQITNLQEIINNESGRLEIFKDGKNIEFNKFDIAIDKSTNTAEVVFVEKKDRTANKGIGLEAYIELGNKLKDQGITLQSMGQAQYVGGKNLWDELVKQGLATRISSGRYEFTGITENNGNNITISDKLDLNDNVTDLFGKIENTFDDEVYSSNVGQGTLEKAKIKKFLYDKLPGLTLADEKTVSETKPHLKDAVGMFYKSAIYLFNGATNSTAYHEAFHGVFRNMLSNDERINILNEAKKQYTIPTSQQLNLLYNNLSLDTRSKFTETQLNSIVQQLYYEEKLSDNFADYIENSNSKTLSKRIKDFFNKILRLFGLFNKYNEDQITTLFEAINTGKFKNRSKQSLIDRNINSPLLQPAFKKPDNIPLAEFLDRSKSIEELFYYRLNQQLSLGLSMDKVDISQIFADIKEEYKSKAIEFNNSKDLLKSAISANVYNNWNAYIDQVTKNLAKRKIRIKLRDKVVESIDLSQVPDQTNNVEDLDILQVESGINKSYGQEMTAISGIRSAGDKLKLFLSALPIIEDDKIKTDDFGFEQFYDYEGIYYQLERALLNKATYEEQYDEVQYLASFKPEMKSVLQALDNLKGEEGGLIKKQFRSNFFKQQLKFKLVLFEKDRDKENYTYKVVDSNRNDIKRAIQGTWESNLLDPSRSKNNLVKLENSEYVVDNNKVIKLQKEFASTEKTKNYLYDTLYNLGIEFNKTDFNKLFTDSEKSISLNVESYLSYLEYQSRDVENKEDNATISRRGREALEWFVFKQIDYNKDLYTDSFNNVENSVVYTIQHNSFSSRLINKLTKGNTDNFIKDLKRDYIYKYLNILESPVITKTLETFAIDGLKDEVGEKDGKKYRSIHPDDYAVMAIAAYINSSGNQSLQGISTAIYTPIVPSEKSQAFLNQGPKYSGFIIRDEKLLETDDTQRFNRIFWLEADRIKRAVKDKELYNSETELLKQGKLANRTFYPNANYHGKNFNGNAYSFNILNYSKDFQKDGKLYNAIFEEFNQSDLNAEQFFGISGKYKAEINNEILNILNNKYQEQLRAFINSNIIKDNNEVLTSNVIDLRSLDNTLSSTEALKNLVAGFTLNTSLFNIEYSLLMNGDPAYYKNSSDWGKRFYQSQAATVSYDSSDFKDGKIQIIAVNDIEVSANKDSYDDIIELTSKLPDSKITKDILDNEYMQENSINVADAQFYASPILYEKLERSQGKITPSKSKALAVGNGSTVGTNSKDFHQQIAPVKTYTFGVEWNDKLSRYEPKQIKCAVLPLTESLVADNPLLKKALDKMLTNPDGPQAIAFKSTFKALQPNYQNIDEVDNLNPEQLLDLEVQNMGLQVDNPNHGLDSDNSSVRQLKMLFYGMVEDNLMYGGIPGSDLKAELQALESRNNLEALNNLVELFANKDEKLLKMINEAITKRNATSIIEKVFEIDPLTGDFRFPLDTLPTKQTIELLSSIFTNNVVLQDFKGGAMIQATSLGFQFDVAKTGNFKTVYQGARNDNFDNRKFNYFALSKEEASQYGSNVREVTIDTTEYIQAYSKEELNLRTEFNNKNKTFDILDNSKEGLKNQENYFNFLEAKGYKGFNSIREGGEENQYLVSFGDFKDQKTLSDLQTSLKWVRKQDSNTIDYIEVALPYYYSDFLNNKGEFKDNIPDELLRIIGYRIPTEGAHSMLPLKVVKFLPKEYGNVILLPYEITKQMGADFDFDKIYFLSRDYYNKGQNLVPYNYNTSPEGLDTRYEQYINSVLNTNKEALQAKKEARADAKDMNKIAKQTGEQLYEYGFEDDINVLIDEGYIVSKEVFSQRPIEQQITREARNNRILDLYTKVLRDVNTLNSLIAPSGPGVISDVFEQVAQYKDSETSDYFSFLGQLKIKKLFDDIIGLKGQSALKVTGHAFVSLGELRAINNPFTYRTDNNSETQVVNDLSGTKSNVGGKVVEELSSMMAAILDAVKTPTMLPYLNISSKTINIWSTIVRFGMGTKIASEFTSQEAIGLVSEKLMSNDKQIKDGLEFSNNAAEEIFEVYKSKFLNLYELDKTLGQKLFGVELATKELNEKLNSKTVNLQDLNEFAGKSEDVVKNIIKKDSSLNKDQKIMELMTFYLTQMNVLRSFENLKDLSDKLNQIDSVFSLNKEVGPTFETVNGKEQLIKEVSSYEIDEDGNGVFSGVTSLLQQPIINSYLSINSNFMELLNQKFGFANDYYNSIKNTIGSGLNVRNDRGLLGIKPNDRDTINSFITSFLDAYSTFQSEYQKSPEEAGFTDSEFTNEMSKLMTDKFDPDYKWQMFGGRKLKPETKQKLANSSLIQNLKVKIVKNSDIKVVSLKTSRLELSQKEKIIQDIITYYNNPVTKPMIQSLIRHNFKYSGFYTGLNSFHNLIDPSILQDMGLINNRGVVKEMITSDIPNILKDSVFINRLIDQFVRNNPKITKTFDLKQEKGSPLFIESVENNEKIYIVNVESRHSRLLELVKKDPLAGELTGLSYIKIYLEDKKTGFKGAKLFKAFYNENSLYYKEVTKLGIKGNLREINPYFDLEKSIYQPNNYINYKNVPEAKDTEAIEEEQNQDNFVSQQDELLESELNNSTNIAIPQTDIEVKEIKARNPAIALRINELLNRVEKDFKDKLISLEKKEQLVNVIKSAEVSDEKEFGDLVNKLCI